MRPHGDLTPSGTPLHYLHARCPALVANLWDVTDGEIDRFSKALLDGLGAGGGLLTALTTARAACKLPFLTGAAPVCYGVPLSFLARGAPPPPRARSVGDWRSRLIEIERAGRGTPDG